MARIGEGAFRQYVDGQDRLTAREYTAERELIRLAVNDLDDKVQRTEGIREEFSNTVNEVETVKGEIVQTKQEVDSRLDTFSQVIDQAASKEEIQEVSTQLRDKASLNGTVYIDMFPTFKEAIAYCLANNRILDLCATTITTDTSFNGVQLCSLKNGTIILNDYVRFYTDSNTLFEDLTVIDNYVYAKTASVPSNFDQHSIGWVFESLNGISDNVVFRRVNSYSTDTRVKDGNYRTRGFIGLLGNNILIDECDIDDCRNAIRIGKNIANAPRWDKFFIKNCRFKNVEQCIDLLCASHVKVQNCSLINTEAQQANFSQLRGADFICSISSDDVYVSDIMVERPVERTVYVINAKRFHLNGFNISIGGSGAGGGLKICGWGDAKAYQSVDCVIENGYCGVTRNQYFDFYGVDGITVRNITTAVNGSNGMVSMVNRNRNITFENVKVSVTSYALFLQAPVNNTDFDTGDTGIELTDMTIKNSIITSTKNDTVYFINTSDATGGTYDYAIFERWNIIDSSFNLDPSITSVKYLLSQSTFGEIKDVKIKGLSTNSKHMVLYDFGFVNSVTRHKNVEVTGKVNSHVYGYNIDFPKVMESLPKGTYSIDMYSSGNFIGNLAREDGMDLVYKRTFKTIGTEYILRRIDSTKVLNFKVLVEVSSATFAAKFLLSSNGTALTNVVQYGNITSNSTSVTLPNGDQLQLDTASLPTSLRYRATTTETINLKITLMNVFYT